MDDSKNINRTSVLVAMSGGIDSAVAAFLLKQRGLNCIGVMMQLHDMPGLETEIESFKRVCKHLNIPAHVIDMRSDFKRDVINYFVDSYAEAKTPNPCVVCNKKIKFGALIKAANKLGCKHIATGHYAQIIKKNNCWELCCGADKTKDQSYFLHVINREDLPKILFPLGKLTKPEVRNIAQKNNLPCANKSESQDICFVEDGKYRQFLEDYGVKQNSGNIINTDGNILGKHNGLSNYTIGQRKGLGVAIGKPAYVCKLDNSKNQVILGDREDALIDEVNVSDFNWLVDVSKLTSRSYFNCSVKLRYRQKATACTVYINNDDITKIKIQLKEKAFAPASGQFAVLYDGATVLGGGTII